MKWSVMMKEFESQSHQLMLLFSLFGLFVICLCLSDFNSGWLFQSPLWSYTVGTCSSVVLVEAVFEAWLQNLQPATSTPTPTPTPNSKLQPPTNFTTVPVRTWYTLNLLITTIYARLLLTFYVEIRWSTCTYPCCLHSIVSQEVRPFSPRRVVVPSNSIHQQLGVLLLVICPPSTQTRIQSATMSSKRKSPYLHYWNYSACHHPLQPSHGSQPRWLGVSVQLPSWWNPQRHGTPRYRCPPSRRPNKYLLPHGPRFTHWWELHRGGFATFLWASSPMRILECCLSFRITLFSWVSFTMLWTSHGLRSSLASRGYVRGMFLMSCLWLHSFPSFGCTSPLTWRVAFFYFPISYGSCLPLDSVQLCASWTQLKLRNMENGTIMQSYRIKFGSLESKQQRV